MVVRAVETTGDWMILSSATTTFAFWLVDTNLCDVPIPTLSSSTTSGIDFSAFAALVAILITLSSTLTANRFSPGRKVVSAAPTKLVVAIPIAELVSPTWMYSNFSPDTKKWFGIVIVLFVVLAILTSFPSKYLSKIGRFSCCIPNALLTSDSVPS